MAKLQIKTRRKPQPRPKIKKREHKEKAFRRVCGYCLHFWRSPTLLREDKSKPRMCSECKMEVEVDTKCLCKYYNGNWVVASKVNNFIVRDKYSPVDLKIKSRKRKVVSIKRRRKR